MYLSNICVHLTSSIYSGGGWKGLTNISLNLHAQMYQYSVFSWPIPEHGKTVVTHFSNFSLPLTSSVNNGILTTLKSS